MSKLRKSARGKECQVRLPGYCNFNQETTILAHINGAGMGMKASDIHGAYCCSSCHDVVDSRVHSRFSKGEVKLAFYEGIIRTQKIMLEEGLIKL